jgi:hypothetical protein
MSDPLVTYVNDHLGGAGIALEILEPLRDQHDDKNLRDLAIVLLMAIQADDHTLRAIAEKIGSGPSAIKEVGGWIVEKAARLKLGHTGSTDFAMFESLELLAIGIHRKLCLWQALQVASRADSRLHGFDFEMLIIRAKQQYDHVERNRLHLAETVLTPTN